MQGRRLTGRPPHHESDERLKVYAIAARSNCPPACSHVALAGPIDEDPVIPTSLGLCVLAPTSGAYFISDLLELGLDVR